jgi:WD40 repeat protein
VNVEQRRLAEEVFLELLDAVPEVRERVLSSRPDLDNELLAGRLPLDVSGVSIPEPARRVRDEQPPRLGDIDRSLRGDIHPDGVLRLVISPDGGRIATASIEGFVRIWDAVSGSLLREIPWTGRLNAIAWLGTGALAYAGVDGVLGITSDNGETTLLEIGIGWIHAAAATRDGRWLALAGENERVAVLERIEERGASDGAAGESGNAGTTGAVAGAQWRVARTLSGHFGAVYSVMLSHDGTRVFAGGFDNMLRVWKVQSGDAVLTLRGHTGAPLGLAMSPDGRTVYSASSDRTLRIWKGQDPPAAASR